LATANVTVTIQVYISSAASGNLVINTFVPIPSAKVTMVIPINILGIIGLGAVGHSVVSGLSVAVAAEDRLLVVSSVSITNDLNVIRTVTGLISAGISIA
jgi:hypothetical protein